MKNILMVLVAVIMMITVGCAGMPMQDQKNMAANATIWGTLGAAGSAIVAAAVGSDPVAAAGIGLVGGALLGAGNTPQSQQVYTERAYVYTAPLYHSNCQQAYNEAYWRERARLERQRENELRRRAQQRAKRDAMWDDYYHHH